MTPSIPLPSRRLVATSLLTLSILLPASQAADSSWNLDGSGNWSDPGNWTAGVPGTPAGTGSTDVATFGLALTGTRTVTVDADRNIGGITFSNSSTNGYILSGGSLRLSNGGVIQTAASNGNHTDTIGSPIQIQGDGGAATFTGGASGTSSLMSIGAVTGVSTASHVTTLTLDGGNTGGNAGSNTITGVIGNGSAGGTLAVVKSGAGLWTLSGANTYSGGTTVQSGILSLSNNGALGAGPVLLGHTGGSDNATLRSAGGNFTYSNAITVQAGSSGTAKLLAHGNNQAHFTGNILLHKDLVLETNNPNNVNILTVSGSVSGIGGLIVQNTVSDVRGTTLSGANTFSGGVTLNRGVLRINNGGSSGTSSALGTGTFTINGGGSTLANTSGSVVTVSTNNAQIWNGDFAFDATAANSLNLGTGAVSLGTAAGATRTVTVSNAAVLTVGGVITNGVTANTLVKSGSGTLVLTGSNAHTGGTTLSRGTLVIGGDFALGSGSFTMNNTTAGETTRIQSSDGSTRVIANAFGTFAGSTATYAFGNTTGGTGDLVFTNTANASIGTGARTFQIDNARTEFAGGFTSSGSITKTGAGTMVLSGSSTYSGGTTVSAGTLLVNNPSGGSATGSGAVTIGAGGGLGGSGFIAGVVTVSGTLAPGDSPGVLTVGGLNLELGSTSVFEIDGMIRGTDFDGIDISSGGPLDLGGDFVFAFGIGSAFANASVFELIDFDTASTGDIGSLVSTGYYAGSWNKTGEIWTLTSGGQTLTFSEITGDLTVVPEPSVVVLLGLGLGLMLRRGRNPQR